MSICSLKNIVYDIYIYVYIYIYISIRSIIYDKLEKYNEYA